nr:HNH endonuclease [Nanoarchaeota archaeon]
MLKKPQYYPNPNPNGQKLVDCVVCGKRKEYHAKDMCYGCYKKQWKSPKIKCKNCGRIRHHHAFGLCDSCHIRLHHYDNVLEYNAKKKFGLDLASWKEMTKKCICCNFAKIVELHHLDGNNKNNSKENLIPLCPNCHKMIHSHAYYKEILRILKEKAYEIENFRPRKLA